MDNEWISRNNNNNPSRKRERRSYDSNWGVYEARAGSSSSSFRSSSSRGALSADGIVVEGQRVGVPHGGDARFGSNGRQAAASGYQQQQQQQQQQPATSSQSSRIRVADYRGSSVRIGQLPVANDNASSFPQQHHSHGHNPSSSHHHSFSSSAASNRRSALPTLPKELALALRSNLAHPPPLAVRLPPELKSTLNAEQTSVVESVLSGHSVFFTGPAGSGKSHILQTLLKANETGIGIGITGNRRKNIVITATTGVAACAVGGTTVHSFAGATADASPAQCVKRVMGNEYAKKRWRECDILVVDEVSMMSGRFLDCLEFVGGRVRNDRRVFGGMQVVVCGDFFQLPPIELAKDGFAFQAKCWPRLFKHSVLLRQVFRQQSDTALMTILDEARMGQLSQSSVSLLTNHSKLPKAAFQNANKNNEPEIIPTLLECRNKNVDQANEREMAKLKNAQVHTYRARDRAVSDSYRNQLKQCQAPSQLDLKVGCQVMLLKNVDLEKGLANGSRGVVVRFQNPKSGSEVLTGFKNMELPVVRFDSVKSAGDTVEDEDREFTILPEEWQNKMGDQTVSARVQIPLRLAWSISVHKSQGMTIPNLTVNLSGVFEYGQAYVALSRATELKLLTLRGFSKDVFRAHPLVKAFYEVLEDPSKAIAAISDKENCEAHRDGEFGELDPFGGCSNPYQQQHQPHKRHATATMTNNINGGLSNPYQNRSQTHVHTSTASRCSRQSSGSGLNQYHQKSNMENSARMPSQFQQAQPSGSTSINGRSPPNNISPTLTQDQKRRMEENRQRALAIRMKRLQGSS